MQCLAPRRPTRKWWGVFTWAMKSPSNISKNAVLEVAEIHISIREFQYLLLPKSFWIKGIFLFLQCEMGFSVSWELLWHFYPSPFWWQQQVLSHRSRRVHTSHTEWDQPFPMVVYWLRVQGLDPNCPGSYPSSAMWTKQGTGLTEVSKSSIPSSIKRG